MRGGECDTIAKEEQRRTSWWWLYPHGRLVERDLLVLAVMLIIIAIVVVWCGRRVMGDARVIVGGRSELLVVQYRPSAFLVARSTYYCISS